MKNTGRISTDAETFAFSSRIFLNCNHFVFESLRYYLAISCKEMPALKSRLGLLAKAVIYLVYRYFAKFSFQSDVYTMMLYTVLPYPSYNDRTDPQHIDSCS